MLNLANDVLREELQILINRFGGGRGALMPVLQEIQQQEQCISDEAMQCLADLLDLHPVEIYGVVSFYSFLHSEKKGHYVVRLCQTISCEMEGKAGVAAALKEVLGIDFGETTEDGIFSLEWANCLGMCDQGPAMLVNDHVFTRVTPEKVRGILEGCRRVLSSVPAQPREN